MGCCLFVCQELVSRAQTVTVFQQLLRRSLDSRVWKASSQCCVSNLLGDLSVRRRSPSDDHPGFAARGTFRKASLFSFEWLLRCISKAINTLEDASEFHFVLQPLSLNNFMLSIKSCQRGAPLLQPCATIHQLRKGNHPSLSEKGGGGWPWQGLEMGGDFNCLFSFTEKS